MNKKRVQVGSDSVKSLRAKAMDNPSEFLEKVSAEPNGHTILNNVLDGASNRRELLGKLLSAADKDLSRNILQTVLALRIKNIHSTARLAAIIALITLPGLGVWIGELAGVFHAGVFRQWDAAPPRLWSVLATFAGVLGLMSVAAVVRNWRELKDISACLDSSVTPMPKQYGIAKSLQLTACAVVVTLILGVWSYRSYTPPDLSVAATSLITLDRYLLTRFITGNTEMSIMALGSLICIGLLIYLAVGSIRERQMKGIREENMAKKRPPVLATILLIVILIALPSYYAIGVYHETQSFQFALKSIDLLRRTHDVPLVCQYVADSGRPLAIGETLIRISDPETENLLSAVLFQYGNKEFAESMLNSGNNRLAEDAKNWATINHYVIRTFRSDRTGPQWK